MIFEDDDIFIYAPSTLCEGKAIGSAAPQDLNLVRSLVNSAALYPFPVDKKNTPADTSGRTVGKRKLTEVQERVEKALMSSIIRFQAGKLTENEFKKSVTTTMRTAWRDVYLAGVRAGGVPGNGAGKGKMLVSVHDGVDDAWLRTATKQEMGFLNEFVRSIIDADFKMSLDRRAKMYVNSLSSFYETARCIAMPQNSLFHWIGPNDKKTCEGCRYLFENGPYTKLTLPTTPRAGVTACLTNCRDRILIRRADMSEVEALTEASRCTREKHLDNLRKIKRGDKI